MVAINESATYETEVTRVETTDAALGGDEVNVPNKQLKQLANRTTYLKTELDKLPVQTVDSEGAAEIGNSEVEVTSGGKTTTVPAQNLHVQMESVVEHLTKHRGTSDVAYSGDHDGRYLRAVQAVSFTLNAGVESVKWTAGAAANPPVVSAFYEDGGREYMVGTGPRPHDVSVFWNNSTYQISVGNAGATAIDVRLAVYAVEP